MAITRQQLKSIVKECLVEILSEGMGSSTKSSLQEASLRTQKTIPKKQVSAPRRGENVKYGQVMAETIKREAGNNPLMESIFADTAANTLPTMMNENKTQQPQPTGQYERVVSQSTPEELFGDDVASKWAELAFMETPKKF